MRKKYFRRLFVIFLITFISVLIAVPKQIHINIHQGPINIDQVFERKDLDIKIGNLEIRREFDLVLGLDLVGGSHLVFEADTSKLPQERKTKAIESLKEVIERRVNLYGVSEPNIQTSTFDNKERIIVELPGLKNTEDAISLVGRTAQLVFAEMQEKDGRQTMIPTDLTGADLKDANVNFDNVSGKPIVSLKFTDEGAKKFENITERNVGKQVGIALDGQLVSAPIVNEKIAGGSAQISGEFSLEDAKKLAIQLNAGSLPVPVHLVEQRTVGATLGTQSVQKSIQAGIAGILIVLVFMIVMYGQLGLVADIGLIIFGILTLSLYKLIPVVLTLPGIAGFLLSVGMAVDSNILIFERFREEKKIRVNIEDALESSFGRAWDSIRDANIATLITAFLLANPLDWPFLHTSGPVRGFAMTLALGIGISLFTGIYVSRNLLRLFIRQRSGKK